jgi:NAD dependent epimerase/dehydratase family enzyme
VPWIAVDDMADVVVRAVVDGRMAGAVNAVAPNPVRQRDYARALGHALHRPAIVPVPRFALKAVLGAELGEHVVESMRASPTTLLGLGHRFRHPTIDDALSHLLGVNDADP